MVKIYYRSVKETQLRELKKRRAGSWVYAESPSLAEIQDLCQRYQLNEDLVKDVMDIDEMPRLEIEDGTPYLFTRFAVSESGGTQTLPVLMVISAGALITISPKPIPAFERLTGGKTELYTTQKTKLLLLLLTHIVDSYAGYLKTIGRKIRVARSGLRIESIDNKAFIQFVGFEDTLNDFLSALIPTSVMLSGLVSGKYIALFEEDIDLVEDLSLNSRQLIESCKSNLKTIVNIREAYSTIMTNNLNRTIKLLTALTIILTVPTVISSIYGMNVALPLASSPYAFYLILAFTAAVLAGLFWLFNRNDWF